MFSLVEQETLFAPVRGAGARHPPVLVLPERRLGPELGTKRRLEPTKRRFAHRNCHSTRR
jgi:hypothetical protein